MNKAVGRHPGAHCPATRAELWLSGPCRRSTLIIASLALSACSQAPVVVPEIIRQPTYIPTPATLTQPIQVTLLPGVTYGEALGELRAGLNTCNASLDAIKTLKSPTPPSYQGSDKPPYK